MPYMESGVGYQRTDTSRNTAEQVDASTIRGKVLDALQRSVIPLTSEEIADALGFDYVSVQPRTAELRNAEKIKDSGERKIGRYGRPIIAWEVA